MHPLSVVCVSVCRVVTMHPLSVVCISVCRAMTMHPLPVFMHICVQGSDSSFPSQLEVTVLTCQSPSLVRAAMDGAAELVNMDHLTRIQVVCINRKQGPLDHVMAEEGVCVCVCVCESK